MRKTKENLTNGIQWTPWSQLEDLDFADTVPNTTLWKWTRQLPLENEIKKRKRRWIGHMLRKPPETITRQAITWNPQGRGEELWLKHGQGLLVLQLAPLLQLISLKLGVFLDIDRSTVRDIIRNSEGVVISTFDILEAWRHDLNVPSTTAMYEQLYGAYMDIKRTDVAERIRSEQVHHLSDQLKKARKTNQSGRQKSNEQVRQLSEQAMKKPRKKSYQVPEAVHEYEMEKYEIAKLLKTPLKKGDTWYLIDAKWFKQWKKYVGFDAWDAGSVRDETVLPGPIDNSPLCKEGTNNTLKEHLIDEVDYNLMPDDAWKKLVMWYGIVNTDMVLSRKVIEQGMFMKHCKVEVYLVELKLCHNQDLEHIVTEQFSKADTISENHTL
ncbi:hypothetical protein NP493_1186g00003 [Ridgeia piscesae]|uniref:DUSP domain-containing protein n=1 Tax=Ridgeia piscesae TaxID=27915 RepID=A0AAD9NJK8_RIDPI|nr:hypothetical protein NP493_1186g00003 [Ridgeia piscesae]